MYFYFKDYFMYPAKDDLWIHYIIIIIIIKKNKKLSS